jgi:hypothetical protein
MSGRLPFITYLVLAAAVRLAPAGAAGENPGLPLTADEIVRRTVERAKAVSSDHDCSVYVFDKRAVHESLNSAGAVKRSREKLYSVTLTRGMTHNRLVAINGHALSAEESAAQSENERRWRDKYAGGPGKPRPERMDDFINERLFSRFDFTLVGRETVRGRPSYVLTFRPKKGPLPDERMIDRVINLLHGRVWIDESDFEIARAEVETRGALRLWGGFLGALETFEFSIEREPGTPDVWFNRFAEIHLRGRRLFTPIQMRVREIAGEFRQLQNGEGDENMMALGPQRY